MTEVTNKYKILLVVGAPRSGTTFLADEIASRVDTPLLPEAQWMIETLCMRELSNYTIDNWQSLSGFPLSNLNRRNFIRNYVQEAKLRKLNLNNIIIDHTPQNILFLKSILQALEGPIEIHAPLRKPVLSVESLQKQFWFNKSIFRAAFYNFRCLLFLFRYRNVIRFYDIHDKSIHRKLDKKFGKKNQSYEHYTNSIIQNDNLLRSHSYFQEKTKIRSNKKSLLLFLLSLPSHLIYRVLLKCV